MAFVYLKTDNATREWQKALYESLIKHTGLKGNRSAPLAAADLHECRETEMPAVLLECGFMDSTTDTPIILTDKYADECAEAIVEVLAQKGGLKKTAEQPQTPPPAKPVKPSVIYQIWDDVQNRWLPDITDTTDYAGVYGHDVCAVYANLTAGNIYYKVHTKGGGWLPEVKNREDYAGLYNKPIDGLMMRSDDCKVHYQVHLRRKNTWLPYVTGYNEKDADNGYAGIIGQEIDAVRIYTE